MNYRSRGLIVFTIVLVGLFGTSRSAPAQAVGTATHFWHEPRALAVFINSLAVGVGSKSVMLASGTSGRTLLRSTDSGATWNVLPNWPPNDQIQVSQLVTWAAKPNAFIAFGGVEMYVTEDNGDSWSPLPYPTYCHTIMNVLPHPTDPATLYVGTTNGFARTVDGGATWDSFDPEPSCGGGPHAYSMAASGNTLYAGEYDNYGGGVYRSDDRGKTWMHYSTGLPPSFGTNVTSVVKVIMDPRTTAIVYALTEQGQVYKTTNSGGQWNLVAQGLGNDKLNAIFLLASEGYVLYGASNTQIYALADSASAWQQRDTPSIPQGDPQVKIDGLAVDSHVPERYIVYTYRSIYTYLPQPSLDSIAPQSAIVGSRPFTLTLRGSDFTRAARIYWNGEVRPTTFIDSNQLTTTISATDLLTSTEISVAVGYPAPYTGPIQALSSLQRFTIKPACTVDDVPVELCTASITPQTARTLVYSAKQGTSTSITVPTGSVTTTTNLTYTPLISPTNPTAFQFAGTAFSLQASRENQPLSSFRFEKPITMTLTYTDTDIAGLNERDLKLLYWNGTSWADVATTCLPTSVYDRKLQENTLSIAVCHLTEFGLFGQRNRTVYMPLVQQ